MTHRRGANGTMISRLSLRALTLGVLLLASAAPALAAPCGTGSFETWLEDFKKEAAAKGIAASAIQAGLTGITLDKSVLARDQSQKVFGQTFEEFSGRMVPPRLTRGADMLKAELMDALRIVERGDIAPQDLRGAWAGEIGQTQFMPSSYVKFAVDFDGNGRRDLLRSPPDVLASTANFLANHGWQRGKEWEPGSANFAAIKEWNKSEVYAKTIGYFATQLSRAP